MNNEMPSKFEKQLEAMDSSIIELCDILEQNMETTMLAFMKQDKVLAERITSSDNKRQITALVNAVESDAMKIMLLQQPVASDMRYTTAVLKITTELERIGAQLRDICSITINLAEQQYHKKQLTIPAMSEKTKQMVSQAVACFIQKNVKQAKAVIAMDDEIDEMFAKARSNMVQKIREFPEYADQAIYLLMVAKYFEKIGDHAVNIADWAIFSKTGERRNCKLI